MSDSESTQKFPLPKQDTQPLIVLPPELSMLEAPPPRDEDATQALPIQMALRGAETEILSILGVPDATRSMKTGEPTPPEIQETIPALPVAPSTDTTLILPAGDPQRTQVLAVVPAAEASLNVSAQDPQQTQVLAVAPPASVTQICSTGEPLPPAETQVLSVGLPMAEDPKRTHDIPEIQLAHHQAPPLPATTKRGIPGWVWAAAAALLLGGGVGGTYLVKPELLGLGDPSSQKTEEAPAEVPANPDPVTPPETQAPVVEIPPALRGYYDKAQKGDAAAMRTLGVMYFNGLNVPPNREEGLRWYRKAAEAGSKAAKKDLLALEGIKP
ncbi:MAG: hypothetical protein Q8O00_06455 [Holophaga sp.]|nr:hypothetical protein [Holophaga sp.]